MNEFFFRQWHKMQKARMIESYLKAMEFNNRFHPRKLFNNLNRYLKYQ